MSTQLQRIQKTFHAFYVLARSAKILCIVGASICAVSALCILTEAQGGRVFGLFGLFGEPINLFEQVADLKQAGIELIAAAIQLTADAVLFALAQNYLKAEQADGTPFTEQGASRLKALGIRCIWIPIVAIVIAEVLAVSQGMSDAGEIGNYSEVITGIVLILVSGIFHYGAELEQKTQTAE